MSIKVLVTGGCSFTEKSKTTLSWPVHLEKYLNLEPNKLFNTAQGGNGNGQISRRVLYNLTELLKKYSANDLLVGIIWSGPERHDFYTSNLDIVSPSINSWKKNPTTFIPGAENRWVLCNWHSDNDTAKMYYRTFHDHVGSIIYTCEHILRIQWFLKLHGIRYFMSTYNNTVLPKPIVESVDVVHLYREIDFSKFLQVEGEYEWCRDHSGLEFAPQDLIHPTTEQHKMFTEQIIIPFLKEHNYV